MVETGGLDHTHDLNRAMTATNTLENINLECSRCEVGPKHPIGTSTPTAVRAIRFRPRRNGKLQLSSLGF
ncbi:MAG: hypothetical protein A2289_05735 [Deltaproteobacteria bacterium RIFOXYA12_FULL_58_15]|nr:MAG: hypothetical protein A2289_05735 [Deltaproteobacteria bacterium RIFOXYA12_FULL_58_15]